MDWLDHDRLGFNYRLSDIACALGLAQLERLDEMLAGRARVAALYGEALARRRGARAAVPGRRRRPARLVRVRRPAPARARPRRRRARRSARRGIPSKPYFPAVHLMSYYRERSATARASSRSARTSPPARSRCRSSREMTEGQVARVAEALRDVLVAARS